MRAKGAKRTQLRPQDARRNCVCSWYLPQALIATFFRPFFAQILRTGRPKVVTRNFFKTPAFLFSKYKEGRHYWVDWLSKKNSRRFLESRMHWKVPVRFGKREFSAFLQATCYFGTLVLLATLIAYCFAVLPSVRRAEEGSSSKAQATSR